MARERGGALAVAVLALVALLLGAHGALLLAGQELAAARAATRLLQARLSAEEGAEAAMVGLTPAVLADTPLWGSADLGSGAHGTGAYRALAVRLSRETWLMEGWGRVPPQDWTARVAAYVWRMDPAARVAAFRGVVETSVESPVIGAESVEGDVRFDRTTPSCLPSRAVLDSLATAFSLLPVHRLIEADSGGSGLAGLGWEELATLLPDLTAVHGTPEPRRSLGSCAAGDPWDWGDPDDPRGPCGAVFVARVARGDLRIEGGRGQGLIVVRGNLHIIGTRLQGLVLVEGRLTLLEGASLTGLVRALGGVELSGGSRVQGSACQALRALAAASGVLGHPVPLDRLGPLVPK